MIALLDILTDDATLYYWSSDRRTFAVALGVGPTADYKPWLKQVGPLSRSRDQRVDAGDITVQNLSGSSVERDVAAALRDREFVGALAVLRIIDDADDSVKRQYWGYLADPSPNEQEVTFRMRQLADAQRDYIPVYDLSETCQIRYKGGICLSVSGLATCPKTPAACDTRGVLHHFFGVAMQPPGAGSTR
jgi:hypothetical protein